MERAGHRFFNGTTDEYLELLDVGSDAIRSVDPKNFKVMTGGFAAIDHPHAKEKMVERVLLEKGDTFDAIAYHQHGAFDDEFVPGLGKGMFPLIARMEQPRPIFYTETGMDTRNGEQFQARELIKKITYAWAKGAEAYTWFSLHDMSGAKSANQPGLTYGLYTKLSRKPDSKGYGPETWNYDEGTPKAAYVAMNTLTGTLRDQKFGKQLSLPTNQYAYSFAGQNSQTIVSWNQTVAALRRFICCRPTRKRSSA